MATELQRPKSRTQLGVNITASMDIVRIQELLQIAFDEVPELGVIYAAPFAAINAVVALQTELFEKLEIINDLKQQIITAKRTLETAVKVYNLQNKIGTIAMDVIPTVNGQPLGTQVGLLLTPVEEAVDIATQELQALEDEVTAKLQELRALCEENKDRAEQAAQGLIDKIVEQGNFTIVV